MAGMNNQIMRRIGLVLVVLTSLLALTDIASHAAGYSPGCGQIPIVYGIPPWGFHTGAPITGATGSFARGHGKINLEAHTVSGILCQEDHVRNQPTRAITMTVEHHLVYQSHYAVMWGFPGNIMKIRVRVRASNDPDCKVGTIGHPVRQLQRRAQRQRPIQLPGLLQGPRPPVPRNTGQQPGPAAVAPPFCAPGGVALCAKSSCR